MQFSNRIIFVSNAYSNQNIWLEGDEHFHITKVLRIPLGQTLRVTNGSGKIFGAEVLEIKPRKTLLQIRQLLIESFNPPKIHLGVALLKGKDIEEVVASCAQLPMATITPLITERSQSASKRDIEHLIDRLRAKSIVCTKQALKPWNTEIKPLVDLFEYTKNTPAPLVFMEPNIDSNEVAWSKISELTLLCGPEGGWSPAEIEQFKQIERAYSFELGQTILRAVNAPFFALGKISTLAPQLFKL